MEDFRQYYDLESYLFDVVRGRFKEQGYLSAFDFFCIVIWKANRVKSVYAVKLLKHGSQHGNLEAAVHTLTSGLAKKQNPKDRLHYLLNEWEFRLAMASAVLTILYPDEFTVYDQRVCDTLNRFYNLSDMSYDTSKFEELWNGYKEFKRAVEGYKTNPRELSLRDKDRWLWGKSFREQLADDVKNGFKKAP